MRAFRQVVSVTMAAALGLGAAGVPAAPVSATSVTSVVDDSPAVSMPKGATIGASVDIRLEPRQPDVKEYIFSVRGERELFVVPARADGTAEHRWTITHELGSAPLWIRSRAADGTLSKVREQWFTVDMAAPKVTQSGLVGVNMPITFHARSTMPGITEYVAQLNTDPVARQSVPPGPDGSATFQFSVTKRGQRHVTVYAVNADGVQSASGRVVWNPTDSPLITSAEFPENTASRMEPGTFTITPRQGDTTAYEYAFNGVPGTLPANADGTGTLHWTPPAAGDWVLTVRSVSGTGIRSQQQRTHAFTTEVRPTTVDEFWPQFIYTGAISRITILGTELTARDTVTITPEGGNPIAATVISASADRTRLVFEADLRTAKPGNAKVVLHSAITGTALPAESYYLNPVPLSDMILEKAPKISGSVKVGGKVSVGSGWWPDPFTYRYQWKSNGVAIKGATGETYTIPAAQAGKRLTVTMWVTRTGFHPASATSPSTGVVAKGTASKVTKKPTITGTAKVGRTVTAAVGTWSPKVTSYKYEWRLNGKVIKGRTGRTLKLTSSMRNKKITVRVIATRTGYLDGSATSAARKVTR